jgi:hypothetical protein
VDDGNDITGGEDKEFREAELVPLDVVEGSTPVALADWLGLPGIEEVPL